MMMTSIQQEGAAARRKNNDNKGARRAVYCALRNQITRFEKAFVQLHGRPPRGSIEKAPLATTYAQYRELKRAIRTDAAKRIQALVRGWRTRRRSHLRLRRTNHQNRPQFSKPVEIRIEKSETFQIASRGGTRTGIQLLAQDEDEEVRAPVEIIGNSRVDDDLVQEKDPSSSSSSFFLSNPERNYPSTEKSADDPSIMASSPSSSFESDDSPLPKHPEEDELSLLSLEELRTQKRKLKEQLKEYDLRFTIKHGRMPNKSEKEPIRYLYNRYNLLKDLIADRTRILEQY